MDRVQIGKLVVSKLVKKFPTLYGTGRSTVMFSQNPTTHPCPDHFQPCHPISLGYISILFSPCE
jgi:hypothetical protein